ncbi:hypothetical protein SBA4_100029 [Candidatus Sulfopaludibacter sp. SbA4]|nr:hypothetical protein SBA4_100029 [Candidatus Sulfopaludibacter sp. SbA4]
MDRRDGGARSASRVEGGDRAGLARGPVSGRRLPPQRRVPPELRLRVLGDARNQLHRKLPVPVRSRRHLRLVSGAGPAFERRRAALPRQDSHLGRLRPSPELRPLLAAAGVRSIFERSQSSHRARGRLVGQEDFYGPQTIYEKLEPHDTEHRNYFVAGPWNHGQWNGNGSRLGAISFGSDTSQYYRENIFQPWFDYWLRGVGELHLAEATTFETGTNEWRQYDAWPPKQGVERGACISTKGGACPSMRAGRAVSTSTSATPPTLCRIVRGRCLRRIRGRSGRCGWSRTSASWTIAPTCFRGRPSRSARMCEWPGTSPRRFSHRRRERTATGWSS